MIVVQLSHFGGIEQRWAFDLLDLADEWIGQKSPNSEAKSEK